MPYPDVQGVRKAILPPPTPPKMILHFGHVCALNHNMENSIINFAPIKSPQKQRSFYNTISNPLCETLTFIAGGGSQ